MPSPLLVLGSTGRVGRALRAAWPAHVPVLWQTRHPTDDPDTITWDVLNSPVPDLPPLAGVVVLAGVTAGTDLGLNTDLAMAAARLGIPVLLASTQAVYGQPTGVADEASLPDPQTDYGRAKLAMEQAIPPHPHVTSLRIANVMGCDTLAAAIQRGPVTLDQFTDGQGPRRMIITPAALAYVICALFAHADPLSAVINVAQPELVAMQALLTAAGATWHWRPAPADALASLEMDVTLLLQYAPDLSPWSVLS